MGQNATGYRLTLTSFCRSVNGLPGSCGPLAPVFESGRVVSFWLSLISMFIHPGLHTIQPGSRAVGTFDDGLLEKVTRIGLAPEDGLIWFVMYPSQKKPPVFPCALPQFLTLCLLLCFPDVRQHIFCVVQPFIDVVSHISSLVPKYFLHFTFVCLFYLCFLSIICSICLLHKQLITPTNPPSRSNLSITFHLSTHLLLLCCWSHLTLCLCLFLFPLILPLDLSLQRLCVEYKLYTERMCVSCDTTFTSLTLIDASCYLAYVCFYCAWQQLINILSIDTHH